MTDNQALSLDGADWLLTYFPETGVLPQTPEELEQFPAPRVRATVPGNAELDLAAAGVLPDPETILVRSNVLAMRKLERNQYWFTRSFPSEAWFGGSMELEFGAIDCFATIWLNGVEIGRTENAFIEYRFDVSNLLRPAGERNDLAVRIESAIGKLRTCDVNDGIDVTFRRDGASLRKPSFEFGTDVSPRLVTAGLWRSVILRRKSEYAIRDVRIFAYNLNLEKRTANLNVTLRLDTPAPIYDGLRLHLHGVCGDSEFTERAEFIREPSAPFCCLPYVEVANAHFWWPAGYGEAALYDTVITLERDGEVLASTRLNIGLRTVELQQSDTSTVEKPGYFRFLVNGQSIFVRGTSFLWPDVFPSRMAAKTQRVLQDIEEMHCNFLRVVGSAYYPDHAFFDWCDAHGILVWKDLGLTSLQVPQNNPAFIENYRKEVYSVVRKLRNHPSLAVWCGNNEADLGRIGGWRGARTNPARDLISRHYLPQWLDELDPVRPFQPSSPYISPKAYELIQETGKRPEYCIPECHLWGPRDYCKSNFYFRDNAVCFATECGFYSSPGVASVSRILSPELLDVPPMRNLDWVLHSTYADPAPADAPFRTGVDVPKAERQLANFFGSTPSELTERVTASQYVQAESVKFMMELYRSQKGQRNGMVIWSANDGWPQTVSNSCIDYYGVRKLAFYYLRRSQAPCCILLAEARDGMLPVVAVNDTRKSFRGNVSIQRMESTKAEFSAAFEVPPNGRREIGFLPVPESGQKLYLLEWFDEAGTRGANHYLYGDAPHNLEEYRTRFLPAIAANDGSFRAEEIGK